MTAQVQERLFQHAMAAADDVEVLFRTNAMPGAIRAMGRLEAVTLEYLESAAVGQMATCDTEGSALWAELVALKAVVTQHGSFEALCDAVVALRRGFEAHARAHRARLVSAPRTVHASTRR